MYISRPEINLETPESANYGISIARQGNWDKFWGNTYLGTRLDTSVGAALGLNNQMATTGLLSHQSVELNQEEWKNSLWYREGLKYSEGMTDYRAKLQSDDYDKIQYQRYLNSKSTGLGSGIVKFAGRLAGQLVDPINYIPFAGLGYKALKLSSPAVTMALAKTTAGRKIAESAALRGAIEVGVSTAAVQPFISESARQIGEERVWQQVVTDIGIGAIFGGAMGKAFGKPYEIPVEKPPKKPYPIQTEISLREPLKKFEIERPISKLELENTKSQNVKFFESKTNAIEKIYNKLNSNTKQLVSKENQLKEISKISKLRESTDKVEIKNIADTLYSNEQDLDLYKEVLNNINTLEKEYTSVSQNLKSTLTLRKPSKIYQSRLQEQKTSIQEELVEAQNRKYLLEQELGIKITDKKVKKLQLDNKKLRKKLNKVQYGVKLKDPTVLREKISSLSQDNVKLRKDLDNVFGDMRSFSQEVQINATKTFSSSVMNVIDGVQADIGESGQQAINDILKQFGIDEFPVPEKIRPIEDIKNKIRPEVEKYDDGIPKIEVPDEKDLVFSDEDYGLMSQADIDEFADIEIRIEEANKMEDIMTLANNCFGGGKI